jgi:hypothetical protein
MCKGCMYNMCMHIWPYKDVYSKCSSYVSTRNEGPSKREFTMTVMYRINQSLTTRIAQYLIDRRLLIIYLSV